MNYAAQAREIAKIYGWRNEPTLAAKIEAYDRAVEAEAYRAGIASTRPTPYTKSLCDLCQEPIAGEPGDEWRWVEDGWSIACVKCWGIIAKTVEAEALENAADDPYLRGDPAMATWLRKRATAIRAMKEREGEST